MQKHKLDIFRVIENIDLKNQDFFAGLTEEEKKAFHPLVVMRWLTGTRNPAQIVFINSVVNPYVFDLANHKELLYKLMVVCSTGTKQRYSWTKSKKVSTRPISERVVAETFSMSLNHARDALVLLDRDTIVEYAQCLGYQQEELMKLDKDLNK